MQTTISRASQALQAPSARRSAARAPAFGTTTSRRTSVQVFAKGKGKGKSALRQGAGMALRTGAASLMLVGTVRKCPAAGLRGAHAQRGAEALVAASGEGTARAR
eukprot:XP_001695602.1 predicted protein [Chlamydomonas reinhardtii]